MGLREEKKKELRKQIRTTALNLFGERGISGTRVTDIVARLRISEATFFNYFPNKHAVCEEAVSDVITRAIGQTISGDAPIQQQLGDLTATLIAEFTADRPLVALLRRHPEFMVAAWMRLQRPQPLLTQGIQTAQAEGSLRSDVPAEMLSESYLANLLMTFSSELHADKSDEQIEVALAQVLLLWTDGSVHRKPNRHRRPARSAVS